MCSRKSREHEIDTSIEKLAFMPLEEFNKVGGSNVQSLLRELLTHLRKTERTGGELEKIRANLEEIRREYIDLYEFAPVGYFNLDKTGGIVKVNLTASDMVNTPKERLIGHPFVDLVAENHRRGFTSFLDDIAQTHSRKSTEIELLKSEGTIFYAQLQAMPMLEKSAVVYRLSIADITSRKKVEKALFESEERLRNIFESMDEGFALCEMIYDNAGIPIDFRYIEVNPAFTKQTGFPVEQVLGHTVKEILPNVESFWLQAYDRVVKSGRSERITHQVAELKKMYEVHVWRSGVGRFAIVFHDIPEIKRAG